LSDILYDVEFHEQEIVRVLDKLNIYKSQSSNGLHSRILFSTEDYLCNIK